MVVIRSLLLWYVSCDSYSDVRAQPLSTKPLLTVERPCREPLTFAHQHLNAFADRATRQRTTLK
jgi:hypothetical protein